MKNKMNKSGMSISIVFLVIAAIGLIGLSLFYSITYEKDKSKIINTPNQIDNVYIKEKYLDFYLDKILEKTILLDKINLDSSSILYKLKENIQEYKDESGNYLLPELENIYNNLTEGEINIKDNVVSVNIKVLIEEKSENLDIKYNYNKIIEKSI